MRSLATTPAAATASRRSVLRFAALGAASVSAAGLGLAAPRRAAAQDVTLTLVAYSTPREAYEAIIPLFQASEGGAGVTFDQSYGGSGDQSRAVEAGLPADIVALSLEPDVTRLIEPGLIAEDWNAGEHKGMVTDSVVALAVRPGNPKGIAGWDDLQRDDVQTITPNPLTSGGARWNVMAAWGAQLEQGKTEDDAKAYLRGLFQRVPVQDKSARESLQTFIGGLGDVLLGYENEFLLAQANGEELEFVVPEQTILIENPVAVVATSANPERAQAFVDFLYTPEAQRVYGEKGYRPVLADVLAEFAYPTPAALFTIEEFGGWADVTTKFFNPDTGIVAEVQQA
jgi:sulfate transport system substrate-binding protein